MILAVWLIVALLAVADGLLIMFLWRVQRVIRTEAQFIVRQVDHNTRNALIQYELINRRQRGEG